MGAVASGGMPVTLPPVPGCAPGSLVMYKASATPLMVVDTRTDDAVLPSTVPDTITGTEPSAL